MLHHYWRGKCPKSVTQLSSDVFTVRGITVHAGTVCVLGDSIFVDMEIPNRKKIWMSKGVICLLCTFSSSGVMLLQRKEALDLWAFI